METGKRREDVRRRNGGRSERFSRFDVRNSRSAISSRARVTLAFAGLLGIAAFPVYNEARAERAGGASLIPADYRKAQSGGLVSFLLQSDATEEQTENLRERKPATPQLSAQDGTNIRINDPSLDTPERTTQSETTLALLGSTICAGYVDSGGGVLVGLSGFSRSADLGITWEDRGSIPQLSDPVLAVHYATGTFYYGQIAGVGSGIGIGVSRSMDDCQTFPVGANASPSTRFPDMEDKPWIAVDNRRGESDGNVYVCWTRFINGAAGEANTSDLRFSRSTDGGVTFEHEQTISPPSDFFPFGCHIDVGPNGEVYVVWADRGTDHIFFRRSFDGGSTWHDPTRINTRLVRHPGVDRIRECEAGQFRPTLNGDIRMLAQAWMAVDTTGGPFAGNIYVVWASDPLGPIDNSDVYFSYSEDGGDTWEPEVRIAGGTLTDQFEPFVEIGGKGAVAISWYDRRNDPGRNFLIDVYGTFSRDGGNSLDEIERLTDESFPVPPLTGQPSGTGNFDPGRAACYMGEYIAVAAGDESFFYAWGDNRSTLVTSSYPNGRPDPDVYFAQRAIPPIVAPPGFCPGDCNRDALVTVDELITAVRIALGEAAVDTCLDADLNGDGIVTVDELVTAVNAALLGCRS